MTERGRPEEYRHRRLFTTSFEEELLEAFREACKREGKNLNEVMAETMKEYIKRHGSNPQPDLNKFIENPEYQAVPSVLESPDRWYRYLENCSIEEIARIQAMVRTIDKQSKDLTFKKKLKTR